MTKNTNHLYTLYILQKQAVTTHLPVMKSNNFVAFHSKRFLRYFFMNVHQIIQTELNEVNIYLFPFIGFRFYLSFNKKSKQ